MKGIPKNKKYFALFFIIISLTFLSACNGITPSSPIISSFTADSTNITEGVSATLSWTVTDASTVTIDQGIGSVALTGSISVSPIETTTYTLTATNSTDSSTSTVSIIVEKALTIQPGSAEGKDSYISSLLSAYNSASDQHVSIGKSTFSIIKSIKADFITEDYYLRTYLQFELGLLPADVVVVSADLKLFQFDTDGTEDFMIALHQVTESWEEGTITWNNRPEFLLSPESTIPVNAGATTWLSWDITSLLQGWLDGSILNHGVLLKNIGEGSVNTIVWCRSSDYTTDPTLCPKLEITYYVP
jgi:hypothetical protein